MTIGVISRNTIFKDGVVRACLDRGMEVYRHKDTLTLIEALQNGDVLLWHFTADDTAPQDDIRALSIGHPDTKIVALAPHALCHALETDCGSFLTAAIPESTSSDAIIGVLLLAEQGYHVSRTVAAPEVLRSVPGGPELGRTEGGPELPNWQRGTLTPQAQTPESCELLSERETAVLALLCAGYSNKLIARALGICDATVKAHLRSSFRRIGVNNRTQAALWASRNL